MTERLHRSEVCAALRLSSPYTPSLSPTVKHEALQPENRALEAFSAKTTTCCTSLVLIEQLWKHNCYAYSLNHEGERLFDTFCTVFTAIHLCFYPPEVTNTTLNKNVNADDNLSVSIFVSFVILFILQGVRASFLTLWVLMPIIVKELLVEIMSY